MPEAAAAAKPKRTRALWKSRAFFLLASFGSSIGLGNIWKFPYMTFKHGGARFMVAYIIALITVAIPILILELTLGQKMQKGSAGALRGITPRLGGVGWVASWAGFMTCVFYCVFLAIALMYLFSTGGSPWDMAWNERELGCSTAGKASSAGAEIFLYQTVTRYFGDQSCGPFEYGKDGFVFAGPLFACVCLIWLIILGAIWKGPVTEGKCALVTATLPFVLLIVLMGYYVNLNMNNTYGEQKLSGLDIYFNKEPLPLLTPDPKTKLLYYDPAQNADTLYSDAVNLAFFSVGVCVGVFYAYGSYNPIKQPVIQNAFLIAFTDFLFSFFAGFLTWSVIGFLLARENAAYNQTSSIGLAFIAFPTAAQLDSSGKVWFAIFCVTLLIAGIDSAFSYAEGCVTNLMDYMRWPRRKAAGMVVAAGIIMSIPFTSNAGWMLLDLADHWISDYFVIIVGLAQCISVGWMFEYETTAIVTPGHASSLRWMTLSFWLSMSTMIWVTIMGFADGQKWIGTVIMAILIFTGLFISYKKSGMRFRSWYHEIFFCGVDKLSMSITSLSNPDESRSWWMLTFEFWFGVATKFFIPIMMVWMLFSNLKKDITKGYGGHVLEMQVISSLYPLVAVFMVIVPMFMCGHPETFSHNVNMEFIADQKYSDALQQSHNLVAAGDKETELAKK